MNFKGLSLLLLGLFSWNAIFGISGGVLLHLHGGCEAHEAALPDSCCHADEAEGASTCNSDSEEDCCFDDLHVFLKAEEISDCRLAELQSIELPTADWVAVLFELKYSLKSTERMITFARVSDPPTTARSMEQLKTIVLRV